MVTTTPNLYRLLVVDDEPAILELYREILAPGQRDLDRELLEHGIESSSSNSRLSTLLEETINIHCDYATQGKEAVELIHNAESSSHFYAAAFIDIRMPPGIDGLETARQLREVDPHLQIFIVTAYSDFTIGQIEKALPYDVVLLSKPFFADDLLQFTASAIQAWRRKREAEALKTRIAQAIPTEVKTSWSINLEEGSFSASPELQQAFTKEKIGVTESLNDLLTRFHPDDLLTFQMEIDSGKEFFSLLYRLRDQQGTYHWIVSQCHVNFWKDHRALQLDGFSIFISNRDSRSATSLSSSRQSALRQLRRSHIGTGLATEEELYNQQGKLVRYRQPYALLHLKINGIVPLVQQSGNSAGHMLLKECYQRLKPNLPGDHEAFIFRENTIVVLLYRALPAQIMEIITTRASDSLSFRFSPQMIDIAVSATVTALDGIGDAEQVSALLQL